MCGVSGVWGLHTHLTLMTCLNFESWNYNPCMHQSINIQVHLSTWILHSCDPYIAAVHKHISAGSNKIILHYFSKLIDCCKKIKISPPNNGIILAWNSVCNIWMHWTQTSFRSSNRSLRHCSELPWKPREKMTRGSYGKESRQPPQRTSEIMNLCAGNWRKAHSPMPHSSILCLNAPPEII